VRAPPADVEEPFQTPVELNVEFPCCNPTCRWKGDGARYHAKPTTGLVTVLYAAQQCSCVTVFGLCNTPSCDRALEWVGHSDRCAPSGRRERERLGSWRGSRGRWKRALAFKPGGRRERERERLGSLRGSRGRWKLALAFKPGGRRERERERERERGWGAGGAHAGGGNAPWPSSRPRVCACCPGAFSRAGRKSSACARQ
jgi:hypothetical protein